MKIMIVVFASISTVFSQGTYVKLSDNVIDFRNRIEEKILMNHKDWTNGNLHEYEIDKDEELGNHKKDFEKRFNLLSKFSEDRFVMENKIDTAKLFEEEFLANTLNTSLEDMLYECKVISKMDLNFLGKDIEFDNYEAHYRNGNLLKLNIRYRRLFNGGVVRNNLSYVEVMYNHDMSVEKVEVKWPKFRKINLKNQISEVGDIFTNYKKMASLQSKVHNESGDTISVDSVKAVGSSFAWCQIENKISPCMSFIQEVSFGKDKIHTFVDVPYFRKYVK